MIRVLLLAMLIASPAWAKSGREGHGGRIWICTQPEAEAGLWDHQANPEVTRELWDYKLAREKWNLTIDLGGGATLMEKVRFALARLAALEPGRAKLYLERAERFMERVQWTDDEFLNFGDIEGIVLKPKNCDPRLVVLRLKETTNPDLQRYLAKGKEFLINTALWESLDITQRAGTILHEITYEDAVSQGHGTAEKAMRLNAWIGSREIAYLNLPGWLKILEETEMGYHHEGFLFKPGKLEFRDGKLAKAHTRHSEDRTRANLQLATGETVRVLGEVTFDADGSVSSGYLERINMTLDGLAGAYRGTTLFTPDRRIRAVEKYLDAPYGIVQVEGQEVRVRSGALTFHPGGTLAGIENVELFNVLRGGVAVGFHGYIALTPDKRLFAGKLAKDAKLPALSGTTRKFKKDQVVYFSPDGKVEDVPGFFYGGTHFVMTVSLGDRMVFEHCPYADLSACESIGNPFGYEKSLLKERLRVPGISRKWPGALILGAGIGANVAYFGGVALVGASVITPFPAMFYVLALGTGAAFVTEWGGNDGPSMRRATHDLVDGKTVIGYGFDVEELRKALEELEAASPR